MRATWARNATACAATVLVLAAVGCTPTGSFGQSSGGAELVASKCTMCHTIDRVNQASKDKASWDQTIARMRTKGAQMTDAEAAQIAEYLSSKK
jgi:cytochrome c5